MEEARKVAKAGGIAVNQLTVAEKVSALRTEEYFAERARRGDIRMLHRLWQRYGETILWDAKSMILADQLERGWGRVEFVLLSRQYLHLSPLVGVA